jgi:flagellar biogenesis protein FliO
MSFFPGYTLFFFLTASSALASPAATSPLLEPQGDFTEMFLRMLGGLALVIAMLIMGAWLFRKTKMFNLYQSGPVQLRILESRSLGYRNSLMVVSYSDQRFLLSVSTHGARLISPLPPPAETPGAPESSFAERLNELQERKNS